MAHNGLSSAGGNVNELDPNVDGTIWAGIRIEQNTVVATINI